MYVRTYIYIYPGLKEHIRKPIETQVHSIIDIDTRGHLLEALNSKPMWAAL